jgi:hypothetical protein
MEAQVQLYRSSMLCDLLMEALEELCGEEKMTKDLAHKVLDGFDHSCLEALQTRAEAKSTLQVRATASCCLARNDFTTILRYVCKDDPFASR